MTLSFALAVVVSALVTTGAQPVAEELCPDGSHVHQCFTLELMTLGEKEGDEGTWTERRTGRYLCEGTEDRNAILEAISVIAELETDFGIQPFPFPHDKKERASSEVLSSLLRETGHICAEATATSDTLHKAYTFPGAFEPDSDKGGRFRGTGPRSIHVHPDYLPSGTVGPWTRTHVIELALILLHEAGHLQQESSNQEGAEHPVYKWHSMQLQSLLTSEKADAVLKRAVHLQQIANNSWLSNITLDPSVTVQRSSQLGKRVSRISGLNKNSFITQYDDDTFDGWRVTSQGLRKMRFKKLPPTTRKADFISGDDRITAVDLGPNGKDAPSIREFDPVRGKEYWSFRDGSMVDLEGGYYIARTKGEVWVATRRGSVYRRTTKGEPVWDGTYDAIYSFAVHSYAGGTIAVLGLDKHPLALHFNKNARVPSEAELEGAETSEAVTSLAITQHNRIIAGCGDGGLAFFQWDASSKTYIRDAPPARGSSAEVVDIAHDPDGKWVMSLHYGGYALIWKELSSPRNAQIAQVFDQRGEGGLVVLNNGDLIVAAGIASPGEEANHQHLSSISVLDVSSLRE